MIQDAGKFCDVSSYNAPPIDRSPTDFWKPFLQSFLSELGGWVMFFAGTKSGIWVKFSLGYPTVWIYKRVCNLRRVRRVRYRVCRACRCCRTCFAAWRSSSN